ncbi:ARM repeat protein interacting WITH ABF2 protein, partial [Trifolium medium]|nr:ARM repeat protein interacting WITH ABF2 protein [Trifolium medium]
MFLLIAPAALKVRGKQRCYLDSSQQLIQTVHIVQRGAVRPLIEMLSSPDVQLREMSAFALGRLAQDTHNQAGIAHNGGLVPLLKLLDSKNGSLQHNAAFALYGLAENE